MALLDLALGVSEIAYVDTTEAIDETDLIEANALTAPTTIYYGNGAIDLGAVIGVNLLNNSNIIATGGADVRLDAGLINVELAASRNLIIDGDSSITMDAGAIEIGGLLTNILDSTTVAFTGARPGTFTFEPPAIGLLNTFNITIEEMQAGDRLVVPIPGEGLNALSESRNFLGQYNGYNASTGYLTLNNGTALLNAVTVRIKMTPAEYAQFSANRATLLLGGQDTFIFPGTPDPGQPDYEAPCFARGTLIATPTGEVRVEDLRVGDLVLTKDHGPQPLRWVGSARINAIGFANNDKIRPIRILAGALGPNRPRQDLLVSPQHRVLVSSKIAMRMFDKAEVLVAAKQLLEVEGISVARDVDYVEYFHILFDQHEIVYSNGAETESLYTGPQALKALGAEVAEEIYSLFPDLRAQDYLPDPARPIPAGREGRALAHRHAKNAKPLFSTLGM